MDPPWLAIGASLHTSEPIKSGARETEEILFKGNVQNLPSLYFMNI